MQFKKDKSGKLEKMVNYIIDKYRPDLKCLNFLCVWRYKEKITDGRLVLAEVYKLSNKNRDVFDYDVMLEVDENAYRSSSKDEKKQLIFHELEHIVVEYEVEVDDKSSKRGRKKKDELGEKSRIKYNNKKSKEITEVDIELEESSHPDNQKKNKKKPVITGMTAQQVFETIMQSLDKAPVGEPARDKQDRIVFTIKAHDILSQGPRFFCSTFFSEVMTFGIPEELEGLRLFLNHAKKQVGIAQNRALTENVD